MSFIFFSFSFSFELDPFFWGVGGEGGGFD